MRKYKREKLLYIHPGSLLKKIRQAHNLTHNEFARLTEIPNSSLSSWENERRTPSADPLAQIAIFYSVSLDYLTGLSQDPFPIQTLKTLEKNGPWRKMPLAFQSLIPKDYVSFVESKEPDSLVFSPAFRADINFLFNCICAEWERIKENCFYFTDEQVKIARGPEEYFEDIFKEIIEANRIEPFCRYVRLLQKAFSSHQPIFSTKLLQHQKQ